MVWSGWLRRQQNHLAPGFWRCRYCLRCNSFFSFIWGWPAEKMHAHFGNLLSARPQTPFFLIMTSKSARHNKITLWVVKLGGTQSTFKVSTNYVKAMGHTGLPEKPDSHNASRGAIKCDLVVPITFTLEASSYFKTYFLKLNSCWSPSNRAGVLGRWFCQGAATYWSCNAEGFCDTVRKAWLKWDEVHHPNAWWIGTAHDYESQAAQEKT